MDELTQMIGGIVLTIITGFFSFKQGKRKSNATIRQVELGNSLTEIQIFKDLIKTLRDELKQESEQKQELFEQLKEVNQKLGELKKDYDALNRNYALLLKSNNELKKLVNNKEHVRS